MGDFYINFILRNLGSRALGATSPSGWLRTCPLCPSPDPRPIAPRLPLRGAMSSRSSLANSFFEYSRLLTPPLLYLRWAGSLDCARDDMGLGDWLFHWLSFRSENPLGFGPEKSFLLSHGGLFPKSLAWAQDDSWCFGKAIALFYYQKIFQNIFTKFFLFNLLLSYLFRVFVIFLICLIIIFFFFID